MRLLHSLYGTCKAGHDDKIQYSANILQDENLLTLEMDYGGFIG
jgi:hypothetical protein